MLISQVTINELKEYANVYHDEDDKLFGTILEAAKQFIVNYTGLTVVQLDEHEDLTVALYVLSNEMYDNRVMTLDNEKLNFVVKQILESHCITLL